jgi:phenylacetate-coenzyme A ligase PaaK-like adenylate-forming protein
MANLLSMYTRTRFFLFLMAIGGLLAACKGNSNERLLDINEMKVIVWDMMKADELYSVQQAKDSTLRKQKKNLEYYEKIFDYHKISRFTFYKSFTYYEAHPLEMKELLDSIDQYANREKNRSYMRYGQSGNTSGKAVSADSTRKP